MKSSLAAYLLIDAKRRLSVEELRDHFFQQGSMTPTNVRAVSHDKPGLSRRFQFSIELRVFHVANRFRQQDERSRFQRVEDFGEKARDHGLSGYWTPTRL